MIKLLVAILRRHSGAIQLGWAFWLTAIRNKLTQPCLEMQHLGAEVSHPILSDGENGKRALLIISSYLSEEEVFSRDAFAGVGYATNLFL